MPDHKKRTVMQDLLKRFKTILNGHFGQSANEPNLSKTGRGVKSALGTSRKSQGGAKNTSLDSRSNLGTSGELANPKESILNKLENIIMNLEYEKVKSEA